MQGAARERLGLTVFGAPMFRRRAKQTSKAPEHRNLRCSFCNKSEDDVRKLIAGPTVFICDECVQVCVDIIADDAQAAGRSESGAAAPDEANAQSQLLGRGCALCGLPLLLEEALPVEERGFLCRGCVDAIRAAIAENNPG